jgi:hypothetical protein
MALISSFAVKNQFKTNAKTVGDEKIFHYKFQVDLGT